MKRKPIFHYDSRQHDCRVWSTEPIKGIVVAVERELDPIGEAAPGAIRIHGRLLGWRAPELGSFEQNYPFLVSVVERRQDKLIRFDVEGIWITDTETGEFVAAKHHRWYEMPEEPGQMLASSDKLPAQTNPCGETLSFFEDLTCPVCDALAVKYKGQRHEHSQSWSHLVKYDCGCVLSPGRTEVQTACPNAHQQALRYRQERDAALAELKDKCKIQAASIGDLPRNHGQPWTKAELDRLRENHKKGMTVQELMKEHERSQGGITSALKKAGILYDQLKWEPGTYPGDPRKPRRHK